MTIAKCSCGSGLIKAPRRDAAGIFLEYACIKCWPTKKARYNQAIFDDKSDYAWTGEEDDIGRYSGVPGQDGPGAFKKYFG